MSKQKIVVINMGHAVDFGHKEFESVKEFNEWAKEVEDIMDLSQDVKIIVGEERCVEIQKGRASSQYSISLTSCNCGKRQNHDPRAWDIKHGIIQEF